MEAIQCECNVESDVERLQRNDADMRQILLVAKEATAHQKPILGNRLSREYNQRCVVCVCPRA